MQLARYAEKILKKRDNIAAIVACAFLSVVSFYHIYQQTHADHDIDTSILHFLYFLFSVLAVSSILIINKNIRLRELLGKLVAIYLPTEIIFIWGIHNYPRLNYLVGLFTALYMSLTVIYVIWTALNQQTHTSSNIPTKSSVRKSHFVIILLISVIALNFGFGVYRLGKLAAVDEPLWTFSRIPNFWKNIEERDWINARVSDKPGLTIAAISGIGLLKYDTPKDFKNIDWNTKASGSDTSYLENFNLAFRLPLLVFAVLMLPLLFYSIKKLVGNTAATFSIIFIGLSPIILGNSRIINPDGLLWIFTSLSVIHYLIYLDEESRKYLFSSALFLVLGLLTKYVANILYIFFFVLIFAEYIFNHDKYKNISSYQYLKKRLFDYFLFVSTSLAILYVFYPAIWGKPERTFIATIYSEAFEPVWPIFAGILSFVIADLLILKSRIISFFMLHIFVRIRNILSVFIIGFFLASIAIVLFNVYSNMSLFDFAGVLSSPKSSYSLAGPAGIFFSDFYPLLFGVSSIALFAIIVFLLKIVVSKKFEDKNYLTIIYLILFIFAYYAGSVVSHVASIIRYQIILFPLVFLMAGISSAQIMVWILRGTSRNRSVIIGFSQLLLIFLLTASLFQIKPFYMGYASILLPKEYYLDLKDMGDGSYEAAHYLNLKPDAKDINIWADKSGVCDFFIGHCVTSLSLSTLNGTHLDYFVLSSGRQSRTTKMTSYIPIKEGYDSKNPEHKIIVGDRSANFVKIIKKD